VTEKARFIGGFRHAIPVTQYQSRFISHESRLSAMQPPLCQGPDPAPRKPKFTLPAGATDCHCHVFADPEKYPLVANRSYTPQLCPLSDYLQLCSTLGVERTVQVNASTYGHDNSVTLDVIAQLGQHRARGVAGLSPDATEKQIERLHAGGMRGVRLSTMVHGYGGPELLASLGRKIQPFGWHVQLHVDKAAELAALEQRLLEHPTPLVFDHLGRVRGAEGVNSPGFRALVRLLRERDDCWVKISSWYRLSDSGPPAYADMKPLAHALIAARPDRVLWGSNWPHPVWSGVMPNDGDLVDLFCEWVPDEHLRQRIFVDNPVRLYGFDSKS
jgi:2-pyrone-4,6-dicarboxylate lactonase